MSAGIAWAILTGEYPPHLGGVADYTRQLARALVAAGDRVDVWAPSRGAALRADDGVVVHALPDVYGPTSLARLTRDLAARRGVRLLVQYVPHAFGLRAMNVPFCAWLAFRPDPVWMMFHEVAFAIERGAPLKHNALGVVTGAMAVALARRADRLFVSTPAWSERLRRLTTLRVDPVWLPIPSSLPVSPSASVIDAARAKLGIPREALVIGSFGTFGSLITPTLGEALQAVLVRDPSRVALLMGRGSLEFAERVLRGNVGKARVIATGQLPTEELAALLAGCSLALQPYPDGVTTRRTTVMASLALGVPVVTNEGALSEAFWRDADVVALAASPSSAELARLVESLLTRGEGARAALGARGSDLYARRFAMENTVRALREAAA